MAAAATIFLWPVVTRDSAFTTAANTQSVRYPWAADGARYTQVPQSDEANLSYPWHVLLAETLERDGELAWWNPHSFAGGAPQFANGAAGQMSPVRLLTAMFVSPVAAHELSSWLHLVGAGFGAYLLMRQLRARWAGAVTTGLVWQHAGFVLAWLHLEVVTPTFVWLPVASLFVYRSVTGARRWSGVAGGVALALLFVSGHVLFAVITAAVVLGWGAALVVDAVRRSDRPERRVVARHALIGLVVPAVVGVGLAAVTVVPTIIELADSPRQTLEVGDLAGFGTPEFSELLLRIAIPDDLPLDADEINYQPFIGTFGALLALVGLFLRGRPGAGFARTVVIVGLGATVADPFRWLLLRLPGFDVFRPVGRYSLWAAFGLAILAGHAVDGIIDRSRRGGTNGINGTNGTTGRPRSGAFTVAAVVLLVGVALNTAQQLSWGRGANPTFWPREPESVFPTRPVLEAARSARTENGWPHLVVPVNRREGDDGYVPSTLSSELHVVFGIDATSGYSATVPSRTSVAVRVLRGDDVDRLLRQRGTTGAENPGFPSRRLRWDLLERFGVASVLLPPVLDPDDPDWGGDARSDVLGNVVHAGPDGFLVELAEPWAGAQLVGSTEIVPDDDAALRRFIEPGFDFRSYVVVTEAEARRADIGSGVVAAGAGTGSARLVERSTNAVTVGVSSAARSWLVLPVNWHEGWSARIDGEDTVVVRVDHNRVAVLVPAGRSEVEFRFGPPGLMLGVVLTIATMGGIAIAASAVFLRRRQPTGAGGFGRISKTN
jgi:hypothetical protein